MLTGSHKRTHDELNDQQNLDEQRFQQLQAKTPKTIEDWHALGNCYYNGIGVWQHLQLGQQCYDNAIKLSNNQPIISVGTAIIQGEFPERPHDVLIALIKTLGYPANRGYCNGFGNAWIQALLLKQLPRFEKRLMAIVPFSADAVNQKIQAARRKFSQQHPLTEAEAIDLEIPAFLDNIVIHQLGYDLHSFFPECHRPCTEDALLTFKVAGSHALEAQGGFEIVDRLSGIYNDTDLIDYFDALKIAHAQVFPDPTLAPPLP